MAPVAEHRAQDQGQVLDAVLVEAAQRHDAEAFGQLYDRYFDRIYSYLSFKLHHTDECEDLAAQVFLKALESLGSYRWQGTPFCSWLFRIAHNLVVDHLRRKSHWQVEELNERLSDGRDFADPERMLDRTLTREALARAAARLTPLQRQVVSLKFAGGLSNAEAAAVLGKTEGAVKALQHAALISLRSHYLQDQPIAGARTGGDERPPVNRDGGADPAAVRAAAHVPESSGPAPLRHPPVHQFRGLDQIVIAR